MSDQDAIATDRIETKSLTGPWEFSAVDSDSVHEGTVPGDVYSDLLEAGVIDHPYGEDNELSVQWVGKTDWVYRRTIVVDGTFLEHETVRLECLGIDTVAEVSVNGTTVGDTRNMHRKYAFDCSDVLEAGENRITVAFDSPVEYAASARGEYPYDVPLIRYPVDHPGRNFIRKAQCHFGWDWGPCLPGVGIWRDIRLVGYSRPRIEYTTVEQRHHDGGDVTLSVAVGLDVPYETAEKLTLSVAGQRQTKTVSLESGAVELESELRVPDPDRWWPNGYGDQPLYDLTVSVGTDTDRHAVDERIGFRELELVREPDGNGGERFAFEVNGVPIYAKGANWIPPEGMRGDLSRERYETLLSSATAANMNMLRVWGGGYYELEEFYDLCDELGILVWQDFMFACALYPANDEFLETVEAEVRYQVRRLQSRPSIALWCGNNENEMSLVSWFADSDRIDDLRADYETLNQETIAPVVETEDPTRRFWQASPSSGGDELEPYDQTRGDLHYWDVWHGNESFDDYESVEPRFVSEFGYQSFASESLLSSVVPDEQLNPTAPIMEHHQRHEGGNERILSQLASQFRVPFDFDDFVVLSQIQQGIAMKTAIEHWRRLKPYCMGTLYWQLNDLWPCASWSSIEYGGRWKALQYIVKRCYADVLVSTSIDRGRNERGEDAASDADETRGTIDVWITSDRPEQLDGTLTVDAYRFDDGRVFQRKTDLRVDAQASETVKTIDIDEAFSAVPAGQVLLRTEFDYDGGISRNFEFLEPYKHLELPDSEPSVAVDGTTVVVETAEPVLFVELDAGGFDGHFSDNYFHMAPNSRREVTFETDEALADGELAETLSISHLAKTY